MIAQLDGGLATPWPGTAQEWFETASHGREAVDSITLAGVVARVRSATGVMVAADEGNRIVAVSDAITSALGWDPDDLVGRRVVTLVPPRFREAHVAGFTRLLSTGEGHVLGVPLELPVLQADGREQPCRLVIERSGASGHALFLASIEPLGPRGGS